ncbi:MAG: PTS sugar transporter subunit IIA [Succinivibrio sp.]
MYSIYLCIMIVAICGISMLLVYIPYYKLHGSFFENILNALTNFAHNNRLQIKEKFNSVRYALDEHCVINRLRSDNLDEIIRVLTDRLYDVRAISSKADFINGIREKMSINPAGIAHGIAIPHTRGAYVRRSALAVATLRTPIKCGASDNKPCDLFFLIATPDDGSSHINLLSNLSLLLSEPGFANKLRNSGSSEEITKRLISCEKNLFR